MSLHDIHHRKHSHLVYINPIWYSNLVSPVAARLFMYEIGEQRTPLGYTLLITNWIPLILMHRILSIWQSIYQFGIYLLFSKFMECMQWLFIDVSILFCVMLCNNFCDGYYLKLSA